MLVSPNWNDVHKLGDNIKKDPNKYKKIIFYPSSRPKYIYYLKDIKDDLIIETTDVIGQFINDKLWDMMYPELYINLMDNDYIDLTTLCDILPKFYIGKHIQAYGDYATKLAAYLRKDEHILYDNKSTIIIDRKYCLKNILVEPETYYGNMLEQMDQDEFNKLKTTDLLDIIKDKGIYETSVILCEYTSSFKQMRDDPDNKNKLKDYLDMVRLKDELTFHIKTLEKIVKKKKNPINDINEDSDLIDVIRDFCCGKMTDDHKQKILKIFGFQHMFTFDNLKKAGFMNKQNVIGCKIKKGSDLIFIGGCTYDEINYFYNVGIDRIFTTGIINCNEFLDMVIDS